MAEGPVLVGTTATRIEADRHWVRGGSRPHDRPMTNDLTVTMTLPPRGREEAMLRVAAERHPQVLRIVATVPAPNFREPHPLDRFLLRRERALERLGDVARLATGFLSPGTHVECELVRGPVVSAAAGR